MEKCPQKAVVAWARPVYAKPVGAPEAVEGEVVDIEFHLRAEKPEGKGWRPLVFADTERVRATAPLPSDEEVERAAKAAAKVNSGVSPAYDVGDLLWSYLDDRAKAHWLRVARAALEAAADPLLAQSKET